MKVLFVSNLFPDAADPVRGQVNATLLHQLALHCELRVVAPRPALPFTAKWRAMREPRPADEPFEPLFPVVPYVPKIGGRVNPALFARALRGPLRAVRGRFAFDVILCAWLYPDGCAVARLAAELGVPFVLIAQGSDVHDYLHRPTRRELILDAVVKSSAVITRSAELARLLREAGADTAKLHPIYNGVDTTVFQPGDRAAARRELGLPENAAVLLYVGNLLPVKNPLLAVRAHAALCRREPHRHTQLLLIGTGPLMDAARRQADMLGFGTQVRLLGRKNPAEVARCMRAADVLVVPSDNEGVPNVVLEAFACRLRVAATLVGGIPEVLTQNCLGRLVPKGDTMAMTSAIADILATPSEAGAIDAQAAKFSWEETAKAYLTLLEKASAG